MKIISTSKFLALVLCVSLSGTVASSAQEFRYHGGQDRPVNREIGSYFEAKVLPAIQQQRDKLELQLSAADRAQLATYRAQLKDNRARSKTFHETLISSLTPEGVRPELTEAQMQQFRRLRAENWKIMQSVGQIAQKYTGAITQLTAEIQPKREQWAADIRAIVAKNTTPEHQEHMVRFEGHHSPAMHVLYHRLRPTAFLLLESRAAASPTELAVVNTSFYPNPAAATSQLDYQVKSAGPITVELLDNNGNKLRTLVSAPNEMEGPHTQPLDLHDLSAGTYFYKITTKSGSETKRFVKE